MGRLNTEFSYADAVFRATLEWRFVLTQLGAASKASTSLSLALGEKPQLPESAQAAQLANGETNLNSVEASSIQY